MKTIYTGNLPFSATEEDVRALFEEYGTVESINMITDHQTGRFRGFAFVELEDESADAAIKGLDGMQLGERTLRINEARERPTGGERRW